MSLLDSIREKTAQLSERTNGYFQVEVDDVTKKGKGTLNHTRSTRLIYSSKAMRIRIRCLLLTQ